MLASGNVTTPARAGWMGLQPLLALLDPRRVAGQVGRYGLISVVALGADFMVFLGLTLAGMQPSLAGAVGYLAGLVLHYVLSVRFVFDVARSAKSHARLFSEFVVSGAVGLCITAGTIAISTDIAHLPPVVGKAAAVVMSFAVVFILRRAIVFAPSR
jgi:putative flippase GtrA